MLLQGYAPTLDISGPVSITPSTGSIAATGYVPVINAGGNVSITPDTGSVVITGQAPVPKPFIILVFRVNFVDIQIFRMGMTTTEEFKTDMISQQTYNVGV